MIIPDSDQIMRWLSQLSIGHYVCDQCHGIHIEELQQLEGVSESRIFIEDQGMIFSTELEVRPGAIFAVVAEVARINMTYPQLKIFLDVVDEAWPRLVACDFLYTQAGISLAQFQVYLEGTLEATRQVMQDAEQMGWLMSGEGLNIEQAVH